MSTELASALIGAASALAVVVVNAVAQRRLDVRRRQDELVAAAISDVFVSLAQSSLGDQQQALERFAQAKARLATYGSQEVIAALLAFQRAGADTFSPGGQAAIAALVSCARDALSAKNAAPADDVLELLFGAPSQSASVH